MQSANTTKSRATDKNEMGDLDQLYGEIGISAVAAAVRFRCETKNPAYAPVVHRRSERDLEAVV
jgi:hypothetical protein